MIKFLPLFFALLCVALTPTDLSAQSVTRFIVDDTNDDSNARDVSPGDGVCADANNRCTLRAAVDEANATSGEVLIVLPGRAPGGNTGTYTLSRVAPNIADNTFENDNAYGDLDIGGSFSKLTIQGTATPGPQITISPNDRVLDIQDGAEVVITRVHVTGGQAAPGNNGSSDGTGVGVDGENGADGGGIRVGMNATVTLDQVAITSNFTSSGGNGAAPATTISRTAGGDGGSGGNGGGIYVSQGASLTLRRSVVEGNGTGDGGNGAAGQANSGPAAGGNGGDGGNGGGIYNAGTLSVIQSTIYANTGGSPSGGADGVNGGQNGVAGEGGSGGGIANARAINGAVTNEGTVTFLNSIIALNTPGDDNQNGKQPGVDFFDGNNGLTVISTSFTLLGNNDAVESIVSGADNIFGTNTSPVDPMILGLNQNQDFAIPVPVLASGSPAINAGSSTVNFDYDGRGFIRPDMSGVADIGVYEANSIDATPMLKIVEIDVVADGTDKEFVEIKNVGNYPVQMDDHVLVSFNASGQACFTANLYGQLEPGKLFTPGDELVDFMVEHALEFDALTSGGCGATAGDQFADDNGAVGLYAGEGGNFTSFAAGAKMAERVDVMVYANTNTAARGVAMMDLCSNFGLSSNCAGSDDGENSSIQVLGDGSQVSGVPSPGVENFASLLPVDWLSFEGRSLKSATVDLEWSVAQEINNAGFSVEMLTDDETWEERAWLSGLGDYAGSRTYRQSLEGVPAGLRNFRLRQYDHDGTTSLSRIISVLVSADENRLLAYPNPATDRIQVEFTTADKGAVPIQIYDARGSLVQTQMYTPQGMSTESTSVDVSQLSRGYYTVRIVRGEGNQIARLIKR